MKKRKGLLIAFLTSGMISVKWMNRLNELTKGIPSGLFWKTAYYEGKNYREQGGYARGRNILVKMAQDAGVEWLFFIDSDVFPIQDAVTRLMAHNKPVVSGIYYMKGYPAQPVIFEDFGSGPYWNYPVEELFPIAGSGLGCTLINMSVFDKFDEANIPYFKENWKEQNPDGSWLSVEVGEDHWFFKKCKDLGIQPMCDSSVMCDHLDEKTGIFFPDEEEVAKIRRRVMEKKGQQKLLEQEDEILNLNPDAKTIVFFNPNTLAFSGDELSKRGIGGTETAIIQMSKQLAKQGHNVFVFCHSPEQGIYDGVRYLSVEDIRILSKFKTDYFIVVRNTAWLDSFRAEGVFDIDHLFLWCHDVADSPSFKKLKEVEPRLSGILALSEWHKRDILSKWQIPGLESKIKIVRNGIAPELFEDVSSERENTILYTSTPFRGLDILLDVFPKIREKVPNVKLKVFSSLKVYGASDEQDQEYEALYEQARNTEGVEYIGTVRQERLAEEMKKAKVLAYPNTFPETFCITTIESVAAGTPVVTTKKAALPETIPEGCAILIDQDPMGIKYAEEFVKEVVSLLQNQDKWKLYHEACVSVDKKTLSWELAAETFSKALFNKQKKKNINTPEYWDRVYQHEAENNVDFRKDFERWDIILDELSEDQTVFDYGCGNGDFLACVKEKLPNAKVFGYDFSSYAVSVCKDKMEGEFSTRESDFTDKEYDVVSCQHVIEHVDNPIELVKKLLSVTKIGGTIYLALPINDDVWHEHLKIWQLQDLEELLNSENYPGSQFVYSITHRLKNNVLKASGRPVEEALVKIAVFKR